MALGFIPYLLYSYESRVKEERADALFADPISKKI